MPTVHLFIKGKVQGVFFRATAKEIADEYGVKGWVKNTRNGDVEIRATGTDKQLQSFIQWCMQGPANAKVSDIVQDLLPEEEFLDFRIIR